MAVASTVTLASTRPAMLLPSLACRVFPPKWVMMSGHLRKDDAAQQRRSPPAQGG
jgi:hypothetical protein